MNDIVKSPISGNIARFIQSIEVSKIVEQYKSELGLDVTTYFGTTSTLSIYECVETGYRFYYPFGIAGDAQFYAALQNTGSYYPQWKWENEKALSFMKENDRVLDVGCGEGNFLKELHKRHFKHVSGIDHSAEALTYSQSTEIPIYNETIETFSQKNKHVFDVLTCFQILEHITDVKAFIQNCLLCLKPGGILILAVPNNNPYLYKHDFLHTLNLPPHHAGLWNKSALAKLPHFFKMNLLQNEVQAISDQVAEYTLVQMNYLSSKNKFIKSLLKFNLIKKIYSKILFMQRNSIEGRNCLAVYQKIDTLN